MLGIYLSLVSTLTDVDHVKTFGFLDCPSTLWFRNLEVLDCIFTKCCGVEGACTVQNHVFTAIAGVEMSVTSISVSSSYLLTSMFRSATVVVTLSSSPFPSILSDLTLGVLLLHALLAQRPACLDQHSQHIHDSVSQHNDTHSFHNTTVYSVQVLPVFRTIHHHHLFKSLWAHLSTPFLYCLSSLLGFTTFATLGASIFLEFELYDTHSSRHLFFSPLKSLRLLPIVPFVDVDLYGHLTSCSRGVWPGW